MTTLPHENLGNTIRQKLKAVSGFRRLSNLQSKLIIPYVLLTLAIASLGIFVITRLVTATLSERIVNQLYEAARVASDAVVRQEDANLKNLRLGVFTTGVSEAIEARDAATLRELLLPLVVNNNIDSLTVLDDQGGEILTLGRDPETGSVLLSQGTDFSSYELVKKALAGSADQAGDKYVGLLQSTYGPAFFTAAPVYNNQSKEVVGAMMVGIRLKGMLDEVHSQALADILLLDPDRKIIASTLLEPEEGIQSVEQAVQAIPEEKLELVNDLKIYDRDYQITFTELMPRGEQLGWLGIILPSSYVVAAEVTSRDLFSLIFSIGTVAVILVGFFLSQSIARPILKLRTMTQSVAAGDLEHKIGLNRADEIGELADAFDLMTLRLRERTTEAARLYAEAIQRNKELAEINAQLHSTQLQLMQSEKLAAIGQLAAGIVHDVKNPLTVIKGVAELMLSEDELTPEMDQEISLIRESALKANNIVSDLLKFARQSKPEMGEYDLRETVEAALRLSAYPVRKAHVQVINDLPAEPVMMVYDSQQIEQVLLNLITNAVQAMPNGGDLRINLSVSDSVAAIAFQDTGIGIPEENLSRIFDPFFTTKPEGEGTGLGLSVSYGIITNHSGQIKVESVIGQGTTFTVLLPVKRLENYGSPA
jgi:signal transduction histidine kinase